MECFEQVFTKSQKLKRKLNMETVENPLILNEVNENIAELSSIRNGNVYSIKVYLISDDEIEIINLLKQKIDEVSIENKRISPLTTGANSGFAQRGHSRSPDKFRRYVKFRSK